MSEQIWAGFSVSVPAGIGTDYGDTWAGRYQAQSSSLFFVNLKPAPDLPAERGAGLGPLRRARLARRGEA